jgi:hypothetical protein
MKTLADRWGEIIINKLRSEIEEVNKQIKRANKAAKEKGEQNAKL